MIVRFLLVIVAFAVLSCAAVPGDVAVSNIAATSIPIEVLKPEGPGPFPAVVMLHDCSGLGPRSSGTPRRWARELVKQGYVVAIPDSFSTRGHAQGVCTEASQSRNQVSPLRRVPDAYDALDHLRALAYVDGEHIGVMGGSHGGTTTLAAIASLPRDSARMAARKGHGFTAAVALYPACRAGNPPWATAYRNAPPLLILAGALDDWTPAQHCVDLAEAARRAGSQLAIKIYPGAHHAFDGPNPVRYVAARMNGNALGGRGATTGGNAEAWADSTREVSQFFARYLKQP